VAIRRIRDTEPLLRTIHDSWRERMLRRFGQLSQLPEDSREDIYEDLDRDAKA
jgi:hypothetical protein